MELAYRLIVEHRRGRVVQTGDGGETHCSKRKCGQKHTYVQPSYSKLQPEQQMGESHDHSGKEEVERPRRQSSLVDDLAQRASEDTTKAIPHGEERHCNGCAPIACPKQS